MVDGDVAQSVYLVIVIDALVLLVVLVQPVGGHDKEFLSGSLYLLDVRVSQEVPPGADLRPCRASE